jgi:putative drug exporter of the RND superfamily
MGGRGLPGGIMLQALGRATYRARWAIVVVWLLLFAVGSLFAPRIFGVLRGGGYTVGNSQSVVAYNKLSTAFGYKSLMFTAVFSGGTAASRLSDARAFRSESVARYGTVLTIAAPVRAPDGALVFERIYSQPQADFGASYAKKLRALFPHNAVVGHLTGASAVYSDMESVSDQDLHGVELVTLPIAIIVLFLIFGSVMGALVPVLMAPVAVTISLAEIYFIGHRIDMSIFVFNTTSMLGLGVAIDYSLFMVNRFREELRHGSDRETAVANTVATSGRAILVSAIVVSVGFYGLTLSGVSMLSSLGIGGSIVTVMSLLVALTLLPALLGILGPRINMFTLLPSRLSTGRAWHRIAMAVMRRPWTVIAVVAAMVIILASPAFHLRPGIPGPQILPTSVDSRAGNDLLAKHLGTAAGSPVMVTVERLPGTPPGTFRSAAFALLDRACSSPIVAGVTTVPVANSPRQIQSCSSALQRLQSASGKQLSRGQALAARHRIGLLSIYLSVDPSSARAESFVTSLRAAAPIPGYRLYVGGQTAGQMDFDNYLYSRFPFVALFVIVVIFAVLVVAFRSLLLPLKAILMNVFSILVAYGVVVWAFQDGHLAGVLGFTPVGNVDSIVPPLLFCVLFGVSTDYEVFLLTRVQEEFGRTGDNEESVAAGLEVTGRIITSAALVMIVVFGAFSFARLVVIKEIGLGLAAAVLIDSTLIRVMLVPATMRLLGRWNWWLPGRGFLVAGPSRATTTRGSSAAD